MSIVTATTNTTATTMLPASIRASRILIFIAMSGWRTATRTIPTSTIAMDTDTPISDG